MQEQKEYYAFISYKREDEKWAKWLQDKLEHYRFPTNLSGQPNLPNHIRPTFRDVTDLNPGLLAEEINNALSNSEWLIVVCSPRSAKSPWVCKEAQTFIDLGRADHIIPFVIEGIPFSDTTATECYPEALLNLTGSKELLAANINEMGRDAAAIKVVARMFNLRFDALWQRYEREQRHKRWMWIGVSVFLAILGLGIGGYFVKQNRTIENQNVKLEAAANRLKEDSLTLANHVSRIQADSVQLAKKNDSIQKQKDSLILTNKLLAEERNNVLIANWGMMENQGRAVSEKAKELIRNGNVITGAALAYHMLPSEKQLINRPYVSEAEQSLRAAYDSILYGKCPYVLLEQHGQVLSISFSRDDKYMLTTSNDQMVRLWHTQTGREIKDCPLKHNQSVLKALFGPNPNEVMTFLYDGEVNLWDLKNKTRSVLKNVRGKNPILNNDGTILAIETKESKQTIYQLWNTKTWSKIVSLNTSDIAFFNQKAQIAYLKGGSVVVCDYNNKIMSQWPVSHSQFVYSLSLSPDDEKLLVCTNDTLSLWDVKTKRRIYAYSGENQIFNGANFSSDGNYIVSHSEWGRVNIFDLRDLQQTPNHAIQYTASVEDAMFSPRLSSFGEFNFAEGIVRLYKNPMLQRKTQLMQPLFHTNNDIYFSTFENHIITKDDGNVILEDIMQGTKKVLKDPYAEERTSKSGKTYYLNMINEICYSPKMGYWAMIPKVDKKVHVYTCDLKKEMLIIPIEAKVLSMTFSRDSKFIGIGCRDKNLYVWDIQANKLHAKLTGHQNGVTSVSFSDDNQYVISGSYDNTVRVWSMKQKKEILLKRDASDYDINSVALSPNNKYYVFADRRLVHVKDFLTQKEIYTLNIDDAQRVFFSHDGRYIYMQRGDYNRDDYDGNHIIRVPFPSYDEVYDFFTPFFSKYSLSDDEKLRYYIK